MSVRRTVLVFALVLAGEALFADASLTNEDVVRLANAGIGDAVIVAKIEASATAFDTSVDALLALSEAGIADDVIAAMVKAGSAPLRDAAPPASGRTTSESGGEPAGAQPKAIAGSTFREALRSGGEGPEMVVVPAGRFRMGCLSNDGDCSGDEKPVHEVTVARPFALSVHEVTFEDYDRFAYPNKVADRGWGRGLRPVINVSWDDAQEYVEWLSSQTGATYRLPSEAEWEYAARAGTATKYHWGNDVGANRANCGGCGSQWDIKQTAPAGSFAPNRFGLYDMHGNVWEWAQDCWNSSYAGAPSDGSPRLQGECGVRVLRGGSWLNASEAPPCREPLQGHLRHPEQHRRFPGGPDARPLNLRTLTSFGGFQGGLAPLGGSFGVLSGVTTTRRPTSVSNDADDAGRRGRYRARTTGAALESHYRFVLWLIPT